MSVKNPYVPRRDERFEYVYEAMEFIEDHQCQSCKFAEPGEFSMCIPVSTHFLMEEPVPMVDDLGSDGVVCRMYDVEHQ